MNTTQQNILIWAAGFAVFNTLSVLLLVFNTPSYKEEIEILQEQVIELKTYLVEDKLDIDRLDNDLDTIFDTVDKHREAIIEIGDYLLK